MQTIIWVIGSVAVLMLIMSFLPLGYTLKGKILIVSISFLLSLIGVAAISSFSLWLTVLMLVALSFFAAYFINNRFETLLVKETSLLVDEMDDDEFGVEAISTNAISENPVKFLNEDLDGSLSETTYLNTEDNLVLHETQPAAINGTDEQAENDVELLDDDISFLLNRNTEVPAQEEKEKEEEDNNFETGYLSDIESLLEVESEFEEQVTNDLLKSKEHDTDSEDLEVLDDLLLDFSLAEKQVAAGKDEILELDEDAFLEERKEKVNLQK
ncbi:ABC transporter permease family protein [Neobacillus dielmonensis]|uniref:ABC transporter permease n=1 Tax=Neobacillus dielmonensis TaxID=1347369 RepID=UPI0005A7E89F|nr:ABC transporter permease [Neobacillus dielmonensis]